VSTGGGEEPAWSHDGRTYDVAPDGRFLMVDEPSSPHHSVIVAFDWAASLGSTGRR
jgi:hypothetical protein